MKRATWVAVLAFLLAPPLLAQETDEKEPQEEPAGADENDSSLAEEASSDPGVVLATRVLGGDVVAVRSDGDGS